MTESKKKILIVDDEPSIRDSLKLLLKSSFDVSAVEDGDIAITETETFQPDLVLLDVHMPRKDGIETLKALREKNLNLPIVMLTGANTVRTAVEAMKFGAYDYINKPFEIDQLTDLILSILDTSKSQMQSAGASKRSRSGASLPEADFGSLVGRSAAMNDIYSKVKQVAERDTTVLITGESGTGKELIARRIHELSKRASGPFIPVNCAAIPETLIESELFGHEKGAFTSAIETRIGQCEMANGGTLFLDEIGELSLAMQVKLLRFLQEQEFYRVGRSKPIQVDVRIVTATNRNLEEMVKEKRFRQDLFYRINVIGVTLPPLRERYEDIEMLVEHFVRKYADTYDGRTLTFTPEAMGQLVAYDWPGNVRELENVIESLLALAPQDTITAEVLPKKISERSESSSKETKIFEGSLKFDEAERLFETDMIIKALKRTNFIQTRAAELLGISRRILKYKMDKLGITEQIASQGQALQE